MINVNPQINNPTYSYPFYLFIYLFGPTKCVPWVQSKRLLINFNLSCNHALFSYFVIRILELPSVPSYLWYTVYYRSGPFFIFCHWVFSIVCYFGHQSLWFDAFYVNPIWILSVSYMLALCHLLSFIMQHLRLSIWWRMPLPALCSWWL